MKRLPFIATACAVTLTAIVTMGGIHGLINPRQHYSNEEYDTISEIEYADSELEDIDWNDSTPWTQIRIIADDSAMYWDDDSTVMYWDDSDTLNWDYADSAVYVEDLVPYEYSGDYDPALDWDIVPADSTEYVTEFLSTNYDFTGDPADSYLFYRGDFNYSRGDWEGARKDFRQLAAKGYPRAKGYLWAMDRKENDSVLLARMEPLSAEAAAADKDCLDYVGLLFGMEHDERGVEILEKAVQKGNMEAAASLGAWYHNGVPEGPKDPANREATKKYVAMSAKAGDPLGLAYMAILYAEDIVFPYDMKTAVKYYRKGADKNQPSALYNLACMDVPLNGYKGLSLEKRRRYLENAAEQEHAGAARALVIMSADQGDARAALRWARRAAELGDRNAYSLLSSMIVSGRYFDRIPMDVLHEACNEAMLSGLPVDPGCDYIFKYESWFRENDPADDGYPRSMEEEKLGEMTDRMWGFNSPQDIDRALALSIELASRYPEFAHVPIDISLMRRQPTADDLELIVRQLKFIRDSLLSESCGVDEYGEKSVELTRPTGVITHDSESLNYNIELFEKLLANLRDVKNLEKRARKGDAQACYDMSELATYSLLPGIFTSSNINEWLMEAVSRNYPAALFDHMVNQGDKASSISEYWYDRWVKTLPADGTSEAGGAAEEK